MGLLYSGLNRTLKGGITWQKLNKASSAGPGGGYPLCTVDVEATVGTVFRFSLWDGGDLGVLQDPMVGQDVGGLGEQAHLGDRFET